MIKFKLFNVLQLMDNLSHSNLPEIVVEVLMTLHEPVNVKAEEKADLTKFTGYILPFFLNCYILCGFV